MDKLKFKVYYYYSKNDPKKEAIDKVAALNEHDALSYFTDRKQMDKQNFINLYNVEFNEETQSE